MVADDDIELRNQLEPGDLGRIIALHGVVYARHGEGYGLGFEAYVARTLAEFVLDNQARGRVFLAERGGELVGCAAMVERHTPDGAPLGQLRWVLVDQSARGTGLGKRLVSLAMDHARAAGWAEVFLETTSGLDAAMGIYRQLGFAVETHVPQTLWPGENDLITMRLRLR